MAVDDQYSIVNMVNSEALRPEGEIERDIPDEHVREAHRVDLNVLG